uniref:Uncharacterized LOC100181229 n=2 Tax=Ciona intestinalis TaxID=7719 RepID=F7ALQ1_CIOIN|nr:uncharacterized protein LOC100181229 isoform X1 [Ciona intestinalis]|eukprot:XP_002127535.1 uncharacterized protein LOC100181229 isoform X1 [Ciona intestinalis]
MEGKDEAKRWNCSQQKFASQMPRGTRLDASGSKLEVKGARNYTSQSLCIEQNEMFEDIVLRGMRADGLSTKLGVKNNKESISKLVGGLFGKDHRYDVVMSHYNTKRQRNNCAKTIFATMTGEELKMIRAEMFPTTIDLQIRNNLQQFFETQRHKLKDAIEVLCKMQETFKELAPVAELLSTHNFQTRGFFVDVLVSMCNFIIQVLEAVNDFGIPTDTSQPEPQYNAGKDANDTTVAEILLSVGSNPNYLNTPTQAPNSNPVTNDTTTKPTTVIIKSSDVNGNNKSNTADGTQMEDTCKEWTTVEMVEGDGQTRYLLVKTPKGEDGGIDAEKLIQLLHNNEGVVLDSNNVQTTQFLNNVEKSDYLVQGGQTNTPATQSTVDTNQQNPSTNLVENQQELNKADNEENPPNVDDDDPLSRKRVKLK